METPGFIGSPPLKNSSYDASKIPPAVKHNVDSIFYFSAACTAFDRNNGFTLRNFLGDDKTLDPDLKSLSADEWKEVRTQVFYRFDANFSRCLGLSFVDSDSKK